MKGHEAGETSRSPSAPADAYGERREGMEQRVPRKHFRAPSWSRACRSCCRPPRASAR